MVNSGEIMMLNQHFCQECRERMMRAKASLIQCHERGFTTACLDNMHQEFDSLVGASRAVNLEQLEQFNRAMASLSRYLRNKLPVEPEGNEVGLLREAIDMGLGCGGDPNRCLELDINRIQEITMRVNDIISER